jgi:flagellar L-ring protein precursor FlgH
MMSDGELRRRKDSRYDARLQDWIVLDGLRAVRPDPQSEGDPRIRGELRSDYRAIGELETSESLAFNLACEVVDIRPNGNLVLEGRSKIVLNDECWTYVLTGICRPEAIGPNNVVLSRDVINLDIKKSETGSVAAGYQRGWFQKLFDLIQPF